MYLQRVSGNGCQFMSRTDLMLLNYDIVALLGDCR